MKHIHIQPRGLKITLLTALVLGCSAFAGLSSLRAHAESSPPNQDSYIVVLKDSVKDSRGVANEHAKKHQAQVSNVYSHALNGYAATMSAAEANSLKRDPRVAYVEPNGRVYPATTQTNVQSWGIDRIDQRSLPLSTTFTYSSSGAGVKIYVIDSGIRKTHVEFSGRAIDGVSVVPGDPTTDDCMGHGTHVAGTAGGNTTGVAKGATLVPVKVFGCNDHHTDWVDVIAAVDYVTADHQPGQPAVANLSLAGAFNAAVNEAISNSIADGVTYAIAAGNNYGRDACNYSPSSVVEAITTSAVDKKDGRPNWANVGDCVDWFAPGLGIRSAWYLSDTDYTDVASGTSTSSPHTAGVAAQYLQTNPTATPQQVRDALYSLTTKNIVKKSRSVNAHLLFTNF